MGVVANGNQFVVRNSEGHHHQRLTHMKPCDLTHPLMGQQVRLDPRESVHTTPTESSQSINAVRADSGLQRRSCAQRLQPRPADALRDPLRGDMNEQGHNARQSNGHSPGIPGTQGTLSARHRHRGS
ncbi:hypothetical protein GCM10027068_11260 [Prescottella soli]